MANDGGEPLFVVLAGIKVPIGPFPYDAVPHWVTLHLGKDIRRAMQKNQAGFDCDRARDYISATIRYARRRACYRPSCGNARGLSFCQLLGRAFCHGTGSG